MKRILMFCPKYFDYDKKIEQGLREQGHLVDLYDERVSNSFLAKVCIRYNVRAYHPKLEKYVQQVIAAHPDGDYDYVFIVKGEGIPPKAMDMLRKAYPRAKFILYLWDSIENFRDCQNRLKLYDRVATFDPQDAKQYNLHFRPLFYHRGFERAQEPEQYTYDIAFVGTAHSSRPRIVNRLRQQCQAMGRKMFSYLYIPHYLVYLYNKLTNREYKDVRFEDLHTKGIPSAQVQQVYAQSRCVLDVEHGGQRGLTIRTIEMLGMEKKVITTNKLIASYDFYDPNNYCIIDRENPVVDPEFFDRPYRPLPEAIQKRYSLAAFLQELFQFEA